MKLRFEKKENKDPNILRGIKIPYGPAKRQLSKWRWYLILLIVSSPLLFFFLKFAFSLVIVTGDGFISFEKVAINSSCSGIIKKLYAEVGQELSAGSVIAQLYNANLESDRIMAEADLVTLDHPEVSYDSSLEALLKKRIRLNEDVLNYEKQHFANIDFLFSQGAATFAERDLAKERKTKAELDYHRARFELSRLLNDPNRSPHLPNNAIAKKRAQINSKIKALELQKARLKQILPYDGRIIDIFANEGESISTGTPLYLLGRSDKISVVVYLSPKYAKYARKGQEAIVKLPDGKSLKAKVNMDTNLTRRLPADLSSPIGSRSLMLIVNLDIESPLPDIHWIDGLPVKVRFKSFFSDVISIL